ncbi:MAG TPA: rhodanese-related sulfurtransferase [Acidimicrobiia bacterium]|nr:rhodanese-related sulfurtransferase [Acidimicrobiia bacterium]
MKKSILFYKFVNLADPDMTVLWQHELCLRLGLLGRVIVSPHGINGTLGGDIDAVRYYKKAMNASNIFRGIHYKWSEMEGDEFPRLSVKAKPELVSFGAPEEIKVDDETGVIGGGGRLRPRELHDFLHKHGDDVVFFDGRNLYESSVGKFKNAVVPQVNTSREFLTEIEKPEYADLKDRPIVTYCTGGIRCEILTVLMKNRGFQDVYQLDGGIVTYGKEFGDKGFWEGKCYVFDGRIQQAFSDKSATISSCRECGATTDHFSHCSNEPCGAQMIICEECESKNPSHLCIACSS